MTQRGRGWRALLAASLLVFAAAAGALAQTAPGDPGAGGAAAPGNGIATDLDHAKEDEAEHRAAAAGARSRAAAAEAEAARLGAARAAAAARLREAEEESAAAIERLADVRARSARARAARDAAAAALERLLPLAVRLSLYPTETLLAAPVAPQTAISDVQVVQGLGREIAGEAAALQDQTAKLAALGAEAEAAENRLKQDLAKQAALAATLYQRLAEAQTMARAEEDAASAASRAAAEDAAHAADLSAALARLAADRARARKHARDTAEALARHHDQAAAQAARTREAVLAAPSGPGLGVARHALIPPVAGAIVARFGAGSEAGPAQGISFQPPPAARVVSPCTGRAVFAGPFRSYGVIVIVDCGEGYDFVLAGLARLAVVVGQALHSGDPVGEMGPDDGKPHLLYVELRHRGEAVDPAPWFRAHG